MKKQKFRWGDFRAAVNKHQPTVGWKEQFTRQAQQVSRKKVLQERYNTDRKVLSQ